MWNLVIFLLELTFTAFLWTIVILFWVIWLDIVGGAALLVIWHCSTAFWRWILRPAPETRAGQALRAALDGVVTPIMAMLEPVLASIGNRFNAALAPFRWMVQLLEMRWFRRWPIPAGPEWDSVLLLVVLANIAFGVILEVGVIVLMPLALMALVVRKVGRVVVWMLALRKIRRPEQGTDNKPFRLLDLPPEIRNKIYAYASESAMASPISIAYTPPGKCRFKPDRRRPQEIIKNLLKLTEQGWHTTPSHRIALLFTNRQIYNEASRLHFEKMTLDYEHCLMPSSLPKLTTTIDIFGPRLHFFRHLEVELSVAETFLFTPAHHEARNRFIPHSEVAKHLHTTGLLLSNITSVKIYPDHRGLTLLEDFWDAADGQAVGSNVLWYLEGSETREHLDAAFPKLRDLVATNAFGSERFGKGARDDGFWKLWYTGDIIGEEERPEWGDFHWLSGTGELCDVVTKLTVWRTEEEEE